MAKLSKDNSTGSLHPRETLFTSGVIASNGGELLVSGDGASTVTLDVRGSFSLTLEVSGTVDGTNYQSIPVRPVQGGPYVAALTGTVAGTWVASCAGYRTLRVRCTAYTSGAATVTVVASTGVLDNSLGGLTSTVIATATAAAGTLATATLAAPGAGLRHYITSIRVTRFAAALLTAAATPVLTSNANLANLILSLPADAAAQGTVYEAVHDFAAPVMSVAQNAATSVTAPATTNVIWRVTIYGYVAP